MEIRRSTCKEVFDAPLFEELVQNYASEITYGDLPPDPDLEQYKLLERTGFLRTIGVFDDDNSLVGVCQYIVSTIPHFKTSVIASIESLYVNPSARAKGGGLRLIRAVKRFAKEDGAVGINWGAKEGSRAAKLLERIAEPRDRVFWMKL